MKHIKTNESLSIVPSASSKRKKIGLIVAVVALLLGLLAGLYLFFGKNGQPMYDQQTKTVR